MDFFMFINTECEHGIFCTFLGERREEIYYRIIFISLKCIVRYLDLDKTNEKYRKKDILYIDITFSTIEIKHWGLELKNNDNIFTHLYIMSRFMTNLSIFLISFCLLQAVHSMM